MNRILKISCSLAFLSVAFSLPVMGMTTEEEKALDQDTYELIIGPELQKFDAGTNTIDHKSASSILGALVGGEGGEVAIELGDLFKNENGNYFNLKFVAPFEEDASRDLDGTLDALKSKARVSVTWQKVRIPTVKSSPNALLTKIGVCQDFLKIQKEETLSENDKLILAFDPYSIEPEFRRISDTNEQNSWIDSNLSTTDRDVLLAADGACSDATVFRGNRDYERRFDLALTSHSTGPFMVFGAEATLANANYSYFDMDDLATEITDDEQDYAIKFYAGRLSRSGSYLGISATFQESYKSEEAQQVCMMAEMVATPICENKIVGGPSSEQTKLVSLSYSKLFQNHGLQLKVTRDLDKDVTGVSVPVWIKQKLGGELNTGVQFDWNSEDKDVKAMLFFNKSFSFLSGT